MRTSKIFILGAGSFVGRFFFDHIKEKENCSLISKNEINFLDLKTFSNIDFNNSIILDCINVNNGTENEIMECNYFGFQKFCNYLKANQTIVKYVYVSTISVLSQEAVESSAYVRSKKIAEDYLMQSGIDYQLMRLSYPIGKGENSNRLISRLISNLKADRDININDISINLNYINDVVLQMYAELSKSKQVFISNNIYAPLKEVVFYLKARLGSKSNITITEAIDYFKPLTKTPFTPSLDLKSVLSEML